MSIRNDFWKSVIALSSLSASLIATECYQEPASVFLNHFRGPAPDQILIGHTEGKGLGYSKGYTSLDLFLSHPLYQNIIVPFIDLRGHIFNDGEYAANAGLGMRWNNESLGRVWGFNAFYDYLETSQRPYNQVSLGFECLGELWDARINGYLPVGHKKTGLYQFAYGNLSTDNFFVRGKEKFAMKGVDSEIGLHSCNLQWFYLYTGAGPYYYWGESSKTENAFNKTRKNAVGGRLRASATFLSYLTLEGVTTYDHIFKWTGQVTLFLSLPFDITFNLGNKGNREVKKSCCLKRRLFEPVLRNEIIVVDRIHRTSDNPEILDPEFNP